jgi:hypothetical protein
MSRVLWTRSAGLLIEGFTSVTELNVSSLPSVSKGNFASQPLARGMPFTRNKLLPKPLKKNVDTVKQEFVGIYT